MPVPQEPATGDLDKMIGRFGRYPEIRLLIWLAIAVAAVVLVTLSAPILASFSDLATIFFLAWLLAFLIRPLALSVARLFGRLRYGVDVVVAYVIVGLGATLLIAAVSVSLVQSIVDLNSSQLSLSDLLATRLAPLQSQLDAAGLTWIRPSDWLNGALQTVDLGSAQGLNAVGGIVASLAGALGTLAIVVFLSVYIAADRDRLQADIRRLVPTRHQHALEVAQDAIGRSFGGFVRGQVAMGIMYGAFAFLVSLVLGLPYAPLIGFVVGVLQTIPYFGPFISWAPPALAALLFAPAAILPALLIMGIAMLVLSNVIQPRIMGNEVGLSPLSVLVAVLIGGKVAGVLGAIFAVPVAAAALAIVHQLRASEAEGSAPVADAAAAPAATSPPLNQEATIPRA